MKINKYSITSALVTALLSWSASADGLRLGTPGYGGNGCPAGSASVTLSPDEQSVSILFDEYLVEAGDDVGKTLDRKSCNIAIPVHVPQGYSISIFAIDYRGFLSVPRGAQARLTAEYFFAGAQGPRLSQVYSNTERDYLVQHNLAASALVWSACGADVNLRINSSMLVRANARGDSTLATVDSADLQAGMIYHIQWKRCR